MQELLKRTHEIRGYLCNYCEDGCNVELREQLTNDVSDLLSNWANYTLCELQTILNDLEHSIFYELFG